MLKNLINSIPNKPGVYIYKDKNGKILYIGKAKDLKKRLKQYFQNNIPIKIQEMISKAEKIDYIITSNEEEALILETNLINKHRPPYNNLIKGDGAYIYIKITNENIPQIKFSKFKENDGSIYIGPKIWKNDIKKLFQILKITLGFRTCSTYQFKKGKPCSEYIFGLCKGRCFKYDINYKNIINLIINFFKGETKEIENLLLEQINEAIKNERYEWAAKLRDTYFNLQKLTGYPQVLQNQYSGYCFYAKLIYDYKVVILTYFKNGKLIDVIKIKEKCFDTENWKNTVINELKQEIGEINIEIDNEEILGRSENKPEDIIEIYNFLKKQIETIIVGNILEKENILNELLYSIQKKLNLKNLPYIIDAVDISHLGGDRRSGSLIRTIGGIPYKKNYRRYKLLSRDEYGGMEELLKRIFSKIDNYPNLLIIDGGKHQLGIVKKIYNNFKEKIDLIDIIGLEKGEARRNKSLKENIYKFEGKIIKIDNNLTEEELNILRKARDEAHRFANKYRIIQMSKDRKN